MYGHFTNIASASFFYLGRRKIVMFACVRISCPVSCKLYFLNY